MMFLDTTFLVAVVDKGDSLHQVACAWAAKMSRAPTWTTEYILLECANLFRMPAERPLAAAIVELVQQIPTLHVEWGSRHLFEEGMRLFHNRPDKEWSLTDCISFVLMQRHGITQALTYDRHFEQAGFEALLRREPT